MTKKKINYKNLTYDGFKDLVSRTDVSDYEKIGFPEGYRKGKSGTILKNILQNCQNFNKKNSNILEIGPGFGELSSTLLSHSDALDHRVCLIDSHEILSQIPDKDFITKIPGPFPRNMTDFQVDASKGFDVILCYSVFQYVFGHTDIVTFLDECLRLLAPGGEFFLGDLPNITMKKRFLSSESGRNYHNTHFPNSDLPNVDCNVPEPGEIDDATIIWIIQRARSQGFHSWVLPQFSDLPMSNRREDILIKRP